MKKVGDKVIIIDNLAELIKCDANYIVHGMEVYSGRIAIITMIDRKSLNNMPIYYIDINSDPNTVIFFWTEAMFKPIVPITPGDFYKEIIEDKYV